MWVVFCFCGLFMWCFLLLISDVFFLACGVAATGVPFSRSRHHTSDNNNNGNCCGSCALQMTSDVAIKFESAQKKTKIMKTKWIKEQTMTFMRRLKHKHTNVYVCTYICIWTNADTNTHTHTQICGQALGDLCVCPKGGAIIRAVLNCVVGVNQHWPILRRLPISTSYTLARQLAS